MKPILLEIEGFGPYAEKQTVDFRPFSSEGFFLIHGATGAGKTTIFDAICFALFSFTSDKQKQKFRSDFLEEKGKTFVKFTFSLGDKFYVATRGIEPKSKSKTDELEGSSEFYMVEADLVTKIDHQSLKKKETNERIKATLKISYDNFTQMVLLPQGRFQAFLQSNTNGKREILSQVFKADAYGNFALILKNRQKELNANLDNKEKERETVLNSASINDVNNLQETINQLNAHQADLASEEKTVGENLDSHNVLLAQAELLTKRFGELERIKIDYKALIEKSEVFEEQKRKIDAIKNAQNFSGVLSTYTDSKAHLERLKGGLEATRGKHGKQIELDKQNQLALETNAERTEKTKNLEQILSQLAGYQVKIEQELPNIDKQKRLASSIEANEAALNTLTTKLDEFKKEEQAIQSELAGLQDLPLRVQTLTLQLEKIEEQGKIFAAIEKLGGDFDASSKSEPASLLAYQQVAEEFKKIAIQKESTETQWRSQQAARLALQLKPTEPCPVCGSVEHPCVATQKASERIVHDADIEALQEDYNKAQAKEEGAKELFRQQKNQSEKITEAINGKKENISPDFAHDSRNEVAEKYKQKHAELKETQSQKTQLENQKNRLETVIVPEINRYEKELETLTGNTQSQKQTFSQNQGRLEAIVATIPQKYWDNPPLIKTELTETEHQVKHLITEADTITKRYESGQSELNKLSGELENIEKEAALALSNFENNQASLKAQLAASPFNSIEQLELVLKDAHVLPELEKSLQAYQTSLSITKSHQENLQKELANQTLPNLKDLMAMVESIKFQLDEIKTKSLENQGQIGKLESIKSQLTNIDNELQALRTASNNLGPLADCANGTNSERIDFQTFYLSFRLRESLIYANLRLKKMQDGRLELRLSDEVGHRGSKHGLNLEVFDYQTNTTRPVNTLSGGETFITSLALALGLSDAITAQSGGMQFDTLFIDEGFGTLDSESREQAIKILQADSMRSKLIGIISHVEDLKHQFKSNSIWVRKQSNGSYITQ